MADRPNLKTDRIPLVVGVCMPVMDAGQLLTYAHKMSVVHRRARPDSPEGVYPHETPFRVFADAVVGTVDEVLDDLRQGIERGVRYGTEEDWAREAWGRYQKFLADRGVTSLTRAPDPRVCLEGDGAEAEAYRARRLAVHDHPTLTPGEEDFVQDLLFSLQNKYTARQLAEMFSAYAEYREKPG